MQADTNAIRAFGGTTNELSDELAAVVAMLSGDHAASLASAFGPVGARFAAALTEATAGLATSVTKVGDDVAASGRATRSAADEFDDAEAQARTHVATVLT